MNWSEGYDAGLFDIERGLAPNWDHAIEAPLSFWHGYVRARKDFTVGPRALPPLPWHVRARERFGRRLATILDGLTKERETR